MFYVGSALRFFDNGGRLNDYFMPGRVSASVNGGGKVSRNIAKSILQYSISDFVLITLEELPSIGLTKGKLVAMEQL